MAGNPTSDPRWIWKLACALLRVVGWSIGMVALGAVAVIRGVRVLTRLRAILAEVLPCPRGHAVPTYGVYECGCGALHEGWAFGSCRVCGQPAGWTPCLACGLPVRSPLIL